MQVKLIAEPWDCGGLYQVGSFPNWDVWGEWNGRFRDDVRRFVKGDTGMKAAFATRLAGSADLYNVNKRCTTCPCALLLHRLMCQIRHPACLFLGCMTLLGFSRNILCLREASAVQAVPKRVCHSGAPDVWALGWQQTQAGQ